MAKKKVKLSSRELAAQRAGVNVNYKLSASQQSKPRATITTRVTASKAPSANSALEQKALGNPLFNPANFANSNTAEAQRALGNPLFNPNNFASSSSSSKVIASKSTKNTGRSSSNVKKSSIGPVKTNPYQHPTNAGADVADPFGMKKQTRLVPAKTGVTGLLGKLSSGMKGLIGGIGEMMGNNGRIMASENVNLSDKDRKKNIDSVLNIPSAMAADMPTGYGSNGEIFYNNNTTPGLFRSDVATPGTDFSRPGSEEAYLTNGTSPITYGSTIRSNILVGNTPKHTAPRISYNDIFANQDARGSQENRPSNRPTTEQAIGQNPFGDMQTIAPIDAAIPDIAPIDAAIPDMTSTQRTTGAVRQKFGAGAFGNGKAVGNPAEQDPYIKELRKSLKGYSTQENDIQRQFEELIKSLDPTYDQYKKEGQQVLDQQQNTDLNRLASVMNAGNVGDSEQRAQAMQRTQAQYSDQLMNLLAKLSTQKNQDIQGYKEKSVDAVNNVRTQRQNAQERIAQLIKQAQDAQWERNYKMQNDEWERNYKMSQNSGKSSTKRDASLKELLTRAAARPSGGREWASSMAPSLGISPSAISRATGVDGWEGMYNEDYGQPKQKNIVSIGGGYVMDKDSGDVFQAY